MSTRPVCCVFDIGKTNKKVFLFDEAYRIVYERQTRLPEASDEDGFPCEDLSALQAYIMDTMQEIRTLDGFEVRAINFSAYGASLVWLDAEGLPLTPLYNYLKPYPEKLAKRFFEAYGPQTDFCRQAASPMLGSLNSGLQAYRLRHEQPAAFGRAVAALHLPQYLGFLLSGRYCSDITGIGCHTFLWDFDRACYHDWVAKEGLKEKLPVIVQPDDLVAVKNSSEQGKALVGPGLHDSSAALIPYLAGFSEPFTLISTGTWSITLNPFNTDLLTEDELQQDCLCYLNWLGKPVKASRLFAGHDHEMSVHRIAEEHVLPTDFYEALDLSSSGAAAQAYLGFMQKLVAQQEQSSRFVIRDANVRRIFVDGGFSRNKIFMQLLARAFPEMEVFAASMPESTALGAALAVHHSWNSGPMPDNLIELKRF